MPERSILPSKGSLHPGHQDIEGILGKRQLDFVYSPGKDIEKSFWCFETIVDVLHMDEAQLSSPRNHPKLRQS